MPPYSRAEDATSGIGGESSRGVMSLGCAGVDSATTIVVEMGTRLVMVVFLL